MRETIILTVALTLVHAGIAHAQEQLPPAANLQGPPELGTTIVLEQPLRRDRPLWLSADFLFWWTKSSPVPVALVTQGNPNDPQPGALGQPGTRILYGQSNVDLSVAAGARFGLGMWFDDEQTYGFEASGFFLERRTDLFSAFGAARDGPALYTPVFDAINKQEIAYFASFPGLANGFTAVHNSSRPWGFDVNFLAAAERSGDLNVDLLFGYRNFQLGEAISAFQVITPTADFAATGLNVGTIQANQGDTISSFDRFSTRNQFNGPQFGARVDWERGRYFTSLTAKVALGVTHQIVDIDGGSIHIGPKQVQTTFPGGIFALPSNMGSFSRDVFAVVPEVTLNVGVNLTCRLRTYVGYNFVYISEVARPGNQIDRVININNVPTDPAFGTPGGPARPAFAFHGSDYWAQGINFGLEFRY